MLANPTPFEALPFLQRDSLVLVIGLFYPDSDKRTLGGKRGEVMV